MPKEYCSGCRTSKNDTRIYRIVNTAQKPVRYCKLCASTRTNIEPAIKQKIIK